MRRICHYDELDPYTGAHPQRAGALRRLVRELSCLTLLYDVVILPPGNFLEHALTLPALRALAPFVRAGRLLTTTDRDVRSPRLSIRTRADEAIEHVRGAGSLGRWREREIRSLVSQWSDLLPDAWPLRRRSPGQMPDFLRGVTDYARETADRFGVARHLLEVVDRLQQSGITIPDRHHLLARLGVRRETLPPSEVARFASLVQAAFLRGGVSSHIDVGPGGEGSTCDLYPGPYLARVQQSLPDVAIVQALPVAWQATPEALGRRLRSLGVELDRVFSLSVEDRLSLVESTEWPRFRELLHSPAVPQAIAREFRDALGRRGLREGLTRTAGLLRELDPSAPALIATLPVPWQLSGQATLGSTLARDADAPDRVALDFASGRLTTGSGRSCELSRAEARLVAVLAIAGEPGLSFGDVETLLGELAELHGEGAYRRGDVPLRTLRNRADVLKSRTNRVLSAVDLAITAARGRWRLSCGVSLVGTAWELEPSPALAPPEYLQGEHLRLWRVLAVHAPYPVDLAAFARRGSSAIDARRRQALARTVWKLRDRLHRAGEAWDVVGSGRGQYRLAPRHPRTKGKVRKKL